ncbi:hypothetical protein NG798_12560 [Ancylothrix sp. C2]|uniref:WD40 domain-containing protein n=1 Tax=Ancylothrix sp. D3o TaxID=2953691 RepID=UPI0021BA9077|nr:hypothetical protein [Ancylothrix sp. D3o]MCT7950625.1 hypothetical protein [Ancylothrix sp. D3o]
MILPKNASNPDEEIIARNQSSIETLYRAIFFGEGEFSLILVRCNYETLRRQMVSELRQRCDIELREIYLPPSTTKVYDTLQTILAGEIPQALLLFGLEHLRALDEAIVSMNLDRPKFNQDCSYPFLLWINDEIHPQLIRRSPDIESWSTSVKFYLTGDQLLANLREKITTIFTAATGNTNGKIPPNFSILGEQGWTEFQSALTDLQRLQIPLNSELQAGVEFVQGRDAYARDQLDQALNFYQQSLQFWQQEPLSPTGATTLRQAQGKPGELPLQNESPEIAPEIRPVYQGIVLFHIGLCYGRQAEKSPAQKHHYWNLARQFYQEGIQTFENVNRPDLVAILISHLGEILLRQNDWDTLKIIAEKSAKLHQTYQHPLRLSQDYGFLAKVAVEQGRWEDAKQASLLAIESLNQASSLENHPDLYPFLWEQMFRLCLVKANRHLNQEEEAKQNIQRAANLLENGLKNSDPRYDTQRYIRILEILRNLYFEEGDYLTAFAIKQQQRSVEQQYGLRAFIGAVRLQPQHAALNPAVAYLAPQGSVSREIIASGRQQDIENLKIRINSHQYTLTIIHGASGVGKSSIITAGLVPALKQSSIRTRYVLPVVLPVYNEWASRLGKKLAESFLERCGIEITPPDSPAQILEFLQETANRNLLNVLIFDQFEEFFWTCNDLEIKLQFYRFLNNCLNLPFVKIILSMRTDCLHYLLEAPQRIHLEAIDNDILSKDILYCLGNFSPSQAKTLIQTLSENAQLYLQPELIEQFVVDLTDNNGEIRPIELQIAGYQLQTKKVRTLAQYQKKGPKEKLVADYLEEVIHDCGPENEPAARMVLYLLTDENNLRPLKTYAQLAAELGEDTRKIEVVLEILVQSGITFLVKESEVDFYQLIHDYLVPLIRHRQETELQTELRFTKEQLRQVLHQEQQERNRAEIAEIEALSSLSQVMLLSHDELGALQAIVKAGQRLKETHSSEILKQKTIEKLRQTLAQVREKNRLQGHQDWVTEVVYSPDGQILASASADATVKLWQTDGTEILTFREHQEWVNSISFSPDGQMIASASWDKTLKIWHLDGSLIVSLDKHNDRLYSVSFSPDGCLLAAGSADGKVTLWNVQEGWTENKILGGHIGGANHLSFSPDGEILAVACGNNQIKLWKKDGSLLTEILAHSERVWKVAFSPDGRLLASASADNTVKIWLLETTGMILQTTLDNYQNWATSISFSPDGQRLATGSWDNTVKIWYLTQSGVPVLQATFYGHTDKVNSVCFSKDGITLASAGADKIIRLWHTDGNCVQTLLGHQGNVLGVNFSRDGEFIATAGFDKTIKFWKRNGALLATLGGHEDWVKRVVFSPTGNLFLSASADNTVKIWQFQPPQNLPILQTSLSEHQDWVTALAFRPDGLRFVSASADKTIKVYSLEGTVLQTLTGHTDKVWAVSFSADGKVLASGSWDRTVKLWNLETGKFISWEAHTDRVFSVCFSPKEKLLASAGGDKFIKIWQIEETNEPVLLQSWPAHSDRIVDVCFSPDGKILASASADHTVKLWKLDGTELQTFAGHKDMVFQVCFSEKENILASAGGDGTVKLWDLGSIEPQALDLDGLLLRGSNWLADFLKDN